MMLLAAAGRRLRPPAQHIFGCKRLRRAAAVRGCARDGGEKFWLVTAFADLQVGSPFSVDNSKRFFGLKGSGTPS